MQLKHIKLSGFKSFVDPTKISFPTNMVGVVGPNGCGKSNVIDAIRWVLGELSAKNLRGESMVDVIFNGSENRKASGQCSIELLFDNSSAKIGGEYASFNEVSIKRVMTRDAQSDYFINNTIIFKDISFNGGNEFLNFDNSKINSTNINIYKTELNNYYKTYLRTDIDRTNSIYQYNPDINGSFVINNNFNNPETENDYSLVKFSLKAEKIDEKHRVFIIGEFNDYKISKKYELKLNNDIYNGEFKFKQGFYNYKYIRLEPENKVKNYSGNFWETQNIYTALIYHKKLTEKFYKLISISELSSVNIKN